MLGAKDGDALEVQYRHTREELGKLPGMLGLIFRKAASSLEPPSPPPSAPPPPSAHSPTP